MTVTAHEFLLKIYTGHYFLTKQLTAPKPLEASGLRMIKSYKFYLEHVSLEEYLYDEK